jgi:hypothetical protein
VSGFADENFTLASGKRRRSVVSKVSKDRGNMTHASRLALMFSLAIASLTMDPADRSLALAEPQDPAPQPDSGQPLEPALPPTPPPELPPAAGPPPLQPLRPPPVYARPPYVAEIAVARQQERLSDPRRPHLVIGGQFSAVFGSSSQTQYTSYGFGPDLQLRLYGRLALELMMQYQGSNSASYAIQGPGTPTVAYSRHDIPVLIGARVLLLSWPRFVSIYAAGAMGPTYSELVGDSTHSPDSKVFFEVQGGGGAEVWIGSRFYMGFDFRGFDRVRNGSPADPAAIIIDPSTRVPYTTVGLGGSSGYQINCSLGLLLF